MADFEQILLQLTRNLHTLRQREAGHGGRAHAPIELINQIDHHEHAIELTEQAGRGQLTEAAWREKLRPLLVDIRQLSEAHPEPCRVEIGDVAGGIINAIIAGRDITAGGDIVTGVKITYNITHQMVSPAPIDPALNPEAEQEPLPDLFPPARHLIGRQTELAQLHAAFGQVVAGQTGQIIFITGNPGYGRLALARALAEQIQKQAPVIVERFKPLDRLPSTRQPETLWRDDPLIGPALAAHEAQLRQYWPTAARIGGISWLAMAAQIARALGQAPAPTSYHGVSDSPDAIKRMLRAAAKPGRGLLLLLENLDDAPSYWLDLLKYLAPEIYQPKSLPILVVVTAYAPQPIASLDRQKYTETLHLAHTLQKNNQGQTLWLGGLLPAEVTAYLGPARPEVSQRLHFLTDGIPTLVAGLWQEWLATATVTPDQAGLWQFDEADPWLVSGNVRDQANELLDVCLHADNPPPYSRPQIEEILSTAALEGYTFTAAAIARALGLDNDDLQDFLDDFLLETEDDFGLVAAAGFVEIERRRRWQNNQVEEEVISQTLYRFAQPYLRHVWAKFQPAGFALPERRLALIAALEAVYYPATDKIAPVLIDLLDATGQSDRARPYRQRRQAQADIDSLRWQVAFLAQLAAEPFEKYRLFDLRLELAGRLYHTAAYTPALEQARAALQLAAELGDQTRRWARAASHTGVYLQAMGEYAAARPYLERALAICEQVLGPKHPDTGLSLHPDTATSLNNLGALLRSLGDYAAARPCYERALAISEQVLGPEHPDTAQSLNNLGALLASLGDYAAARPCYERALAIREQVLGPEHPDTARSLNNLGMLLQATGDYAGARPHLERVLAIREQVLGPEHPDTARSLNNLGALLNSLGDDAAARPTYERALAIREQVLGPEHPDTAQSLNNLGFLLQATGDTAGARPYYERALAIWEKVLGPEHPDTAQSLNNLGFLLQSLGDYAAARPYVERALAIREQVLGPAHPDTAFSLNNLGVLCFYEGDYPAAAAYMRRALAIREQKLGPNHPHTQSSRQSLQNILAELKNAP